MSEFEKELEKNMELNKVAYRRESFDSDFLVSKRDIGRIFHDWQPQKPLVVVPQIVSDWFDINQDDINGNIIDLTRNICRKLKIEWSEMDKWFMYSPNKPIETLISMKLDGYTVEKEQKYLLKHIDFCKTDKHYDWFTIKHSDGPLNHLRVEKGEKPSTIDCKFTKQEIDSMQTGSYEQIEVEP